MVVVVNKREKIYSLDMCKCYRSMIVCSKQFVASKAF